MILFPSVNSHLELDETESLIIGLQQCDCFVTIIRAKVGGGVGGRDFLVPVQAHWLVGCSLAGCGLINGTIC